MTTPSDRAALIEVGALGTCRSWPGSPDCKTACDACKREFEYSLRAMEAAGVVAIPAIATSEMIGAADPEAYQDGHEAMLAASPYRSQP